MKNKIFMFLLVFAAGFCVADDPIAAVLQSRNKELETAKKDYDNKLSEIDANAIEKLAVIMKNKVSAKDFDGAKRVKQAIMSIENPQAANIQDDKAQKPKEAERIILKTQPAVQKAIISDADKYPEGSFKKFGHNYYIFPVQMNYEDSKSACSSLGGHLLSLDSDEEYEFFLKAAIKDGKAVWLDLTYNKDKKIWEKWDGRKAIFFKWHSGFPVEIEKGALSVMFNYANKKTDMVNVPGRNFSGSVICEWEN